MSITGFITMSVRTEDWASDLWDWVSTTQSQETITAALLSTPGEGETYALMEAAAHNVNVSSNVLRQAWERFETGGDLEALDVVSGIQEIIEANPVWAEASTLGD